MDLYWPKSRGIVERFPSLSCNELVRIWSPMASEVLEGLDLLLERYRIVFLNKCPDGVDKVIEEQQARYRPRQTGA